MSALCGLIIASGSAQIEVDVEEAAPVLEPLELEASVSGEKATTASAGSLIGSMSGTQVPSAADSPEAVEAITAAQMLVAPRSEVVGEGDHTTAALPAVMADATMTADDSISTEARAIASGAELLRKLGLTPKRPKAGGREIDDPGAVNLFPNEEEVRKLLGDNPQVVYRVVVNGTPLPDPMIIPWIRQGRVVEELFDEAVVLLGNGRIDSAREKLLALMTEYPSTEQAAQAREILAKLENLQGAPTPRPISRPSASPTPVEVQLNPNVKVSTVLIDPNNPADSRVVIGGRAYAVGEAIRNYPDHKVVSISDDTVIIEVEKQGVSKQFPIPVRPAGSN